MRSLWLVMALSATASIATAASKDSPIVPAAEGQMQWYQPDTTRKTCRSLAAYKTNEQGVIDNIAIVLISPNPAITMTTHSQVTIKENQVCGAMHPQDIEAATFALGDRPANPQQTAVLRQQMQTAMKSFFGREVCTAYVPNGASLVAKATIDGVPQPAEDQNVIWVLPRDGYRVAPLGRRRSVSVHPP